MEKILDTIVGFLWGMPLIFTILITGFYLSLRSGLFQFAFLGHILKNTFGTIFVKSKEGEGKGLLSPLEAFSTAVGGTIGVGNIGGVATAIATGGPGAIFWMWISACLGMIIKTAEVTLAVYYRNTDEEGNPYGGPTYYIEKGIGEEMGLKFWKILAIVFGGGIFATFFVTLQNYTVSEAINSTFKIGMIPASLIYCALTYAMIYGGIKHLGKIASKIVPIMCVFYIVACIYILLINIGELPAAFALIFKSAFSPTAAVGGFAGAGVRQIIRMGMARSIYSNEAGWGTSPMIHSTSKVDHPVKQGLWGAFEVFTDTIIVCSLTALTVIITGEWCIGVSGATLTLNAFEHALGAPGKFILTIAIFLFGITTSSGWYSYYEIILRHCMKGKTELKNKILKIYKPLYQIPGVAMVVYAVSYGLPGKYVWYFADITSAVPTFVNVFAVLLLSKKFFELLKDYKARYLGIGKIDKDMHLFYEDKVKVSQKSA